MMKGMKITSSSLIAAILFGLVLCSILRVNPLLAKDNDSEVEYVQDEIIVKFKGEEKPFRVLKVPAGKVKEKVKEYQKKETVEYAEPNYIARALFVPNDPYYSYQWHLDNPVYGGINLKTAWDISTGHGVTVAIIDTGIRVGTDLAGTCFVAGYDFVNNDRDSTDDNGHGTHVAGTVAQSTNNSLGVAGVAFNSCLLPVKVLDSQGSGTYANVAAGIRFAADKGTQVINLSLGGGADSQTLREAVAYAYNKGVTLVAAMGNNNEASALYPAGYDEYVIAVGATRYDETKASYSNYGPSLDLVAPGGDLTVDQNHDGYGDGVLQQTFTTRGKKISWGYYFFQGTSMAAPHVAGVASLVIAQGVTSPDRVREALQSTAEDLDDLGWDQIYGWGLIDAYAALTYVPGSVDNPPTVNITSPPDGATVSGTMEITAEASDDFGVVQVNFYVNPTLVSTDTSAPYSVSWNTTSVADGSYSLTARAVDTAAQSTDHSITVFVDNINNPPVANAGPDQSAYVGETVYFDGSSSTDDGELVSYEWNFGDGETASGVTVSHVYSSEGTYTTILTVTDNGALSASDAAIISVTNPPAAPTIVGVNSITYAAFGGKNNNLHLSLTLALVDDLGKAVANAAVSIELNLNGTLYKSETETTGSEGTVTFTARKSPAGCYTTVVTNVIAPGLAWDGVTPTNSFCK